MSQEPEAAVAILHAYAPVESILLIRRAINPRDPWSGHWAFPGGRRDPEDQDLLDTALRELREECSILLTRDQMSQSLPHAQAGQRVGRQIWVAPFGFALPAELPTAVDLREAAEAVWAPVQVLADRSLHTRMPIPGLPPDMQWPAIILGGVPLWGFTYRLVCQWIGFDMAADS